MLRKNQLMQASAMLCLGGTILWVIFVLIFSMIHVPYMKLLNLLDNYVYVLHQKWAYHLLKHWV